MMSTEFHRHGDPFWEAIEKYDKMVAFRNAHLGEYHCHGDPMLNAVLQHDQMITMHDDDDWKHARPTSYSRFHGDPVLQAAIEYERRLALHDWYFGVAVKENRLLWNAQERMQEPTPYDADDEYNYEEHGLFLEV